MPTYEDIQDQFSAYEAARDRHYHALRKEVSFLFSALEQHLQLQGSSWTDENGSRKPYLMLVSKNRQGTFEKCGVTGVNIDAQAKAVCFGIGLVLEHDQEHNKISTPVVELLLGRDATHWSLSFLPEQGGLKYPISAYPERFAEVCEAIGGKFLAMFDPKEFPGG